MNKLLWTNNIIDLRMPRYICLFHPIRGSSLLSQTHTQTALLFLRISKTTNHHLCVLCADICGRYSGFQPRATDKLECKASSPLVWLANP